MIFKPTDSIEYSAHISQVLHKLEEDGRVSREEEEESTQ